MLPKDRTLMGRLQAETEPYGSTAETDDSTRERRKESKERNLAKLTESTKRSPESPTERRQDDLNEESSVRLDESKEPDLAEREECRQPVQVGTQAVSYTHLTLPTRRTV